MREVFERLMVMNLTPFICSTEDRNDRLKMYFQLSRGSPGLPFVVVVGRSEFANDGQQPFSHRRHSFDSCRPRFYAPGFPRCVNLSRGLLLLFDVVLLLCCCCCFIVVIIIALLLSLLFLLLY